VEEIAPGLTLDDVQCATAARLIAADNVREMTC
jgi:acyl CoA:acetate/3-ketoacid CoA transferase beta subunit